jgi:hypothetical protein
MPLRLTVDRNDPDYLYMHVHAADEHASISTYIYVGHRSLQEAVAGLERFRHEVHGGVYDLNFGIFGPKYASGALHVRLAFQSRGWIHMTMRVQTQFALFGAENVASEATLHSTTVVCLLDDFVRAMQAMSDGFCDEAQV